MDIKTMYFIGFLLALVLNVIVFRKFLKGNTALEMIILCIVYSLMSWGDVVLSFVSLINKYVNYDL